MSREHRTLVVKADPLRMLLGALASTFFVALGAYLCAGSLLPGVFANPYFYPPARVLVFAAGAATVLFFGFSLGRLLYRRRPILEVGPEGMVDHASALGAGIVPWEEVEGVGVRRFLGQRFLAVRVRDPRALLARQGPAKRWAMRFNQRITGAPINVPLGALAVGERELVERTARYLRQAARGG